MKILEEYVTEYRVSTQERGKPDVYVVATGPLPVGSWSKYEVQTRRFFGFVQYVHHETYDLEEALQTAKSLAQGVA